LKVFKIDVYFGKPSYANRDPIYTFRIKARNVTEAKRKALKKVLEKEKKHYYFVVD